MLDAKLSTLEVPVVGCSTCDRSRGLALSLLASRLPGARRYCHGIVRLGLCLLLCWALQTFPDGREGFLLCLLSAFPKAHITCSRESRPSFTGWVNEGLLWALSVGSLHLLLLLVFLFLLTDAPSHISLLSLSLSATPFPFLQT